MENNIFKFATKELSQDAFLAWLINWYSIKENAENKAIKKCVKEFLWKILEKKEKWKKLLEKDEIEIQGIEVQFFKIDVLVLLKNKNNNEYLAIIIEDKVSTSEHDAQIEYYKYNLHEFLLKIDEYKNIPKEKLEILTVYYKPYDECNIEEKNVDYVFSREKIIETFRNINEVKQEYLQEYMEYINAIEECAQKYDEENEYNIIIKKKKEDIKYLSFFKEIKDGKIAYQKYIDNNINKNVSELQLLTYYGKTTKNNKEQKVEYSFYDKEKIYFDIGTTGSKTTWWCNLPLNFQIDSDIFSKYAFIKINFYKDKKNTLMLKFAKKREPIKSKEEYNNKFKEECIYFSNGKKYKLYNTFDTRVFKKQNKKQVYFEIFEKLKKTKEYCDEKNISINISGDGSTKQQSEINIFTITLNGNIKEQMKNIEELIKNIIKDLDGKKIKLYTEGNYEELKVKWIQKE